MPAYTAYIGLGSNLGERAANIRRALELLAQHPRIEVATVSSPIETKPVGFTDQPDFVNAVARLTTDLGAKDLLAVLLGAEDTMGRERTVRWGPRIIDLDLLLYDDETISEEGVEVPHPRMMERAFVLAPLAEIAPDLVLPDGRTASEAARAVSEGPCGK